MDSLVISALNAEAVVWKSQQVSQIRLSLNGSRTMSLWLGQCAHQLMQRGWVNEAIAGINSLTLKNEKTDKWNEIFDFIGSLPLPMEEQGRLFSLPVEYDPQWGDTKTVCEHLNLDFETLVSLHSNCEYYIACIGFLPGFVYLSGGNEKISIPRKATPDNRVNAGSVAIADHFTGIYPCPSPGGWHIIGKTPVESGNGNIFLQTPWKVGDRVILKAVIR